jgi:hypothetical protein
MNFDTSTIIATVVVFAAAGALYYFLGLTYAIVAIAVGFGIYFIYAGWFGDSTRSTNLTPNPVDSSSTTVVPGSKAPPQKGPHGGDYGMQWWMYINDWDYKFGERKPVIRRGDNGVYNPFVFLHPTENTLSVKISVFPADGSTTGSSEPAPTGSTGEATDDSFTCSVPNVPLQKWFAVSVSVSGRNLDIYLDGQLVRSCLLSGVPKSSAGNLEIMPGGGFSGSVIDTYYYSRSLVPADAQSFFSKGTNGPSTNSLPSKPLFGYSVKLGVEDDSGKVIKQFTL